MAGTTDCSLLFYDMRIGPNPFFKIIGHHNEVFSVEFCPFDDYLCLSGGADGVIKLWDLRKMH